MKVIVHRTEDNLYLAIVDTQTPLSWETVENHNLDYIRFNDCAVTDSVGYPELPMITCLIALSDSVAPHLEFAWAGEQEFHVDPVYPSPVLYLDTTTCTASVADSFYKDSTAYASSAFWPGDMVRVIGETRLCGQRLIQVQLFPARYTARKRSGTAPDSGHFRTLSATHPS